jgi:hypothetical protein
LTNRPAAVDAETEQALLSSRGGADDSGRITILVYHCFSRSTFLVICDRSFDADASFLYPSFDHFLRTKQGVDHAYMGGRPWKREVEDFVGVFVGNPRSL